MSETCMPTMLNKSSYHSLNLDKGKNNLRIAKVGISSIFDILTSLLIRLIGKIRR